MKKYLYYTGSSAWMPQRFWTGVLLTEKQFNELADKGIYNKQLKRKELSPTEKKRYKRDMCFGDFMDTFVNAYGYEIDNAM